MRTARDATGGSASIREYRVRAVMRRRAASSLVPAYLVSVIAAPLAGIAAAAGLTVPGLYRDPALLVPQPRGQDLVTLFVGVPLLVGALVVAARGSARGHLLWFADIVPATLAGGVPTAAREAETPTSATHVLDLALVLPELALAGGLLLRRAPWGYVLAAVLLVKAATLRLAILAIALFMSLAQQPFAPAVAVFFGALTLSTGGLGAAYMRALGPLSPPAAPRPATRKQVA